MANKDDKPKVPQGQERDAAMQPGQEEGRHRIQKWLRRAQAIVGIRTPGTRRRQGMCEAAERKARREMPAADHPGTEDHQAE